MVGVSQAQTPQTQPQSKTWKVGDIYNVNGKKGVVFTVSPDGKHGVIISMKQPKEKKDWNSAKAWGASLTSTGWRLPTVHELQLIWAVRTTLNEALYWAKGDAIRYNWYWSSEEHDSNNAWYVGMSDGYASGNFKNYYNSVRAVSAF